MKGTILIVADKPDKQWKRSDGVTISDEGCNTVPNRFDGEARAFAHYEDHKNQYPGLTQAQYVQKASDLASSAASGSILGFSTDDGCVIRYNKTDNDFAMAMPGEDGYVRTLFKPTDKATYYHNQKKILWKFRKVK